MIMKGNFKVLMMALRCEIPESALFGSKGGSNTVWRQTPFHVIYACSISRSA
jgi:hypothetical protein